MRTIRTNEGSAMLPPICIEMEDYERLSALAGAARLNSAVDDLKAELDRAQVVPAADFPANTVRMGSGVAFRDHAGKRVQRVRLVYPQEADISKGWISVLTPIGAALIGLSAGQTISWETRTGEARTLTVLSVSPPEAMTTGARLHEPA